MTQTDTAPFEPLVPGLTSRLSGAVSDLSEDARGLLFCELSILSYTSQPFAQNRSKGIGFTTCRRFTNDGFAGFLFANDTDVVIAFRGINVRSLDNFDDVLAIRMQSDGVHPGFRNALQSLWKIMAPAVAKLMVGRTVWTCGHSLGGAMGVILAGLCKELTVEAIYSYGAPRTGNPFFSSSVKTRHERYVNHHDIVPHMPPAWKGYMHHGTEHYFNGGGDLVTGFWGRLKRLFTTLADWMHLDSFADHSIFKYRERLLSNQERTNG